MLLCPAGSSTSYSANGACSAFSSEMLGLVNGSIVMLVPLVPSPFINCSFAERSFARFRVKLAASITASGESGLKTSLFLGDGPMRQACEKPAGCAVSSPSFCSTSAGNFRVVYSSQPLYFRKSESGLFGVVVRSICIARLGTNAHCGIDETFRSCGMHTTWDIKSVENKRLSGGRAFFGPVPSASLAMRWYASNRCWASSRLKDIKSRCSGFPVCASR